MPSTREWCGCMDTVSRLMGTLAWPSVRRAHPRTAGHAHGLLISQAFDRGSRLYFVFSRRHSPCSIDLAHVRACSPRARADPPAFAPGTLGVCYTLPSHSSSPFPGRHRHGLGSCLCGCDTPVLGTIHGPDSKWRIGTSALHSSDPLGTLPPCRSGQQLQGKRLRTTQLSRRRRRRPSSTPFDRQSLSSPCCAIRPLILLLSLAAEEATMEDRVILLMKIGRHCLGRASNRT